MSTIWAFGTTRGAEVVSFNPNFGKGLEGSMIVLPNFCQLDANQPTFYAFKKIIGGLPLTWIGIYYKAYEVGYKRDGGFFGAGAWLNNETADPSELLTVLEDVVLRIRQAAMLDGQFHCKLDSVLPQITPNPTGVEKLLRSLRPGSDDIGISLKTPAAAAFSQNTQILPVLSWALKEPSARFFNSITVSNVNKTRLTSAIKYFDSFNSKDTAIVATAFAIISEQKQKIDEAGTVIDKQNTLLDRLQSSLSENKQALELAKSELQRERAKSLLRSSEDLDSDDSIATVLLRTIARSLYYAALVVIGIIIYQNSGVTTLWELFLISLVPFILILVPIVILLFASDLLTSTFPANSDRYQRELLVIFVLNVSLLAYLLGSYTLSSTPANPTNPTNPTSLQIPYDHSIHFQQLNRVQN